MERRHYWRKLTRYDKILLLIFLLSLPLVNPWVRGDGVGYYAYARALVVNGNLRFEPDWLHANASFLNGHVNSKGEILAADYTPTGYLDNHFTIGPALDWMPFLFLTHLAVRGFDFAGGHIPADGFSWPYTYTMAMVTAAAGFLGLMLSFSLARKYFPERWAFLATVGIWFAGTLPVYMYFNPSWSHAHSAFAVSLFLWYWDRTRGQRETKQWIVLGLIGAWMLNIYYLNAVLLLAPLLESAWLMRKRDAMDENRVAAVLPQLGNNALFAAVLLCGLLPTFLTRWIIYGSPLATGYVPVTAWNWSSPVFLQVLFSSDHGLFSWTPILILASVGLIFLVRRERQFGTILLICALAFYFVISSYPDWDGISSFGNRFFISLTPIFILALAALFTAFEKIWQDTRKAWLPAYALIGLLILWNAGLIFQWGMHLIPTRGTFEWSQMVDNQFRVVPRKLAGSVESYFTRRSEMMQSIEKRDLRELQEQDPKQNRGKAGS
jgi:hypothetical protein